MFRLLIFGVGCVFLDGIDHLEECAFDFVHLGVVLGVDNPCLLLIYHHLCFLLGPIWCFIIFRFFLFSILRIMTIRQEFNNLEIGSHCVIT